jgi:hypothetical protein
MSLQKVKNILCSMLKSRTLTSHLDGFEVAIFLRESRTRHSLLTRNKTFHGQEKQGQDPDLETNLEDIPENTAANTAGSTNDQIMIESDSEPDGLHDLPESTDDVTSGNRRSSRSRRAKASQAQPDDVTGDDKKKLRFSTHYESFNICGWVLCLLVTRKGDKTKSSAATIETRPPLMEEWISTQAQTSVDD